MRCVIHAARHRSGADLLLALAALVRALGMWSALHDAADETVASTRRARLAGSVVNTEIMLEVTELAVGAPEHAIPAAIHPFTGSNGERIGHESFCREVWPVEVASRMAGSGDLQPVQQVVRGSAKIGRNDPCPCGSGKKYKKCCGTNA